MPILTKIHSASIQDDAITSAKIGPDIALTGGNVGIPVVANDSARNTAIPSPTNGMLTYNTAANAVQQYNGTWSTIAPAPSITSISGFLNNDTDSTITLFGSGLNSATTVRMFSASSGGSQIGSNATTTLNSSTKLTAVFGAGSIGASGSVAYIEVDNSGASQRFATAITVNADPVIALSGNTGTGADTTDHLGTYTGVATAGGPEDNSALLLNFDRGGGADWEDSSNVGRGGTTTVQGKIMDVYGDVKIKASPFGDGKTAITFTDDTSPAAKSFSVAHHASLDFDGEFTIEFWCWQQELGATANYRFFQKGSNSVTGYNFAFNGSAVYYFGRSDENKVDFTQNLVDHSWHHIAVTRQSDNLFRLYLDGIIKGVSHSGATADNLNDSGALVWGASPLNGSSHDRYGGMLDEIRIVKGVAVYTGDFKVPTTRLSTTQSAGTNIAAISGTQTSLLVHSNLTTGGASYNSITDSSSFGHTITNTSCYHSTLYSHANGVAENTVIAPAMPWPASGKTYGSVGAHFDGTTDSLTLPLSADWSFPYSESFTLDLWMYATAPTTSWARVIAMGGNNNGWALHFNNTTGQLQFGSDSITLTSNDLISNANSAIAANTWTHIAVVYDQSTNTMKLYKNGVAVITKSAATASQAIQNWWTVSSQVLHIGKRHGNSYYFTGYLDVIRISKGVARWTANFTPPTTLYGEVGAATLPTSPAITLTGATTPALAADEDIEYTSVANTTKPATKQHLTDSGIGLTLTNLTGSDKNKATLTGTIASPAQTSHTNMAVKAQVRKTLGNAAYANASRVVTFSSSTTTVGLAPAMPVSGTGIPAGATITSVDTSTTITLSANPTGGTLTGQSLVFLDLTRIAHINGTDVLDNAQNMMTIATGMGSSSDLFNGKMYRGNGVVARHITGFGFTPDLVWAKERESTDYHQLHDSVRGNISAAGGAADKGALYSNDPAAWVSTIKISMIPDGFSIDAATAINQNEQAEIAWGWKAGGHPLGGQTLGTINAGNPSGAGTIANTGNMTAITQSVSQTTGFCITKYNGTSTANQTYTLPHNLGAKPDWIIVKSGVIAGWVAWHSSLTASKNIRFDTNAAEYTQDVNGYVDGTATDSTNIILKGGTSSALSVMNGGGVILYAWKAVAGKSSFGSFTGTGGSMVKTGLGFRPRWLMVKAKTGSSKSWMIRDSFRGHPSVSFNHHLYADLANAESTDSAMAMSFTADGFTLTGGSLHTNELNRVYIYMAFA